MASTPPGFMPPELPQLARAADRLTFVYVERCRVHRDENAITATDERGTVHIPAATLGTLMLGPGTTVTHQAMTLLHQSGVCAVWTGEEGVRYYGHGRPLAESSRLLEAQAKLFSTTRGRLRVAKAMYQMRFPGEDVSGLTLQQLRGREGVRMRRAYQAAAKRFGIRWSSREYDPNDFDNADAVNRALSAANAALYGVVHSVVVALGLSPGLGFVHTGTIRSFVYDVADLYKADLVIPLAFQLAAEQPPDISSAARRGLRDLMVDGQFLKRCVGDIRGLLLEESPQEIDEEASNDAKLMLWGGFGSETAAKTNYGGR